MARNDLPATPAELLSLGDQMLGGLNALGTSLGITDITPATFSPVLTAFANSNNAYITARSAQLAASQAAQAADANNANWLLKVRGVLTGRLGARWSTAWAAAGFVNGSTAVPATAVARLALVGQLVNYFTANPSFEVATMDVTDTKASALHYAATGANNSHNAAKSNTEAKSAARNTADAALRTLMRGLIGILAMKLTRNDSRWTQFGLNIPASSTTPGEPQNVTVTVQPAHTLVASCDATPMATRYRWRMKVIGVDESFRLAASTTAPLAEIKSVAVGQTVDLYVQAVNGGSQGVASETVRVVLPLAQVSVPIVTAAAAPASLTMLAETPIDLPMVETPHAVNSNGTAPRHGTDAVAVR